MNDTKDINVRVIPACMTYSAEYDVNGLNDFFDTKTGANVFFDLLYQMQNENPDVFTPEIGDDYCFFEFPHGKNPDGTVHIRYFDMVGNRGKDNADGAYRFVEVPEIKAATMMVKGKYDDIGKAFDMMSEWIIKEGYEICGPGRISAINGPWDRESEEEYVNELQIPVR